jgi:hypothetical protein
VWLMLSSPNAFLINGTVTVTLFLMFTKFNAHLLSDPSGSHIRPHTQLQMKRCEKSAPPLSSVKFCTVTLNARYYNHLPLHRTARWYHQSRKLWIAVVLLFQFTRRLFKLAPA